MEPNTFCDLFYKQFYCRNIHCYSKPFLFFSCSISFGKNGILGQKNHILSYTFNDYDTFSNDNVKCVFNSDKTSFNRLLWLCAGVFGVDFTICCQCFWNILNEKCLLKFTKRTGRSCFD